MAQTQYETENEVLELTSEDNETLDVLVKETEAQVSEETLKEAYHFLQENEPSKKAEIEAAGIQNTVITSGTISNSMPATLTFTSPENWHGTFTKRPSQAISARGIGTFVHTAISAPGAKGGLLYTGRRSNGSYCAWLLAWHNASDSVRKVYAQVGERGSVLPVNSTRVETALDNSSSSVNVRDPVTGAGVTARITGSSGNCVIAATFS